MKEVLKLEIQAIGIVHILAIMLAIIFFMMFYMKAKRDFALKAFLVMQISIIGWMVFKIFKTVSPTLEARWWFVVAYYFCACVFEVAYLEFMYSYYTGEQIKKKVRYLVYIIPFIQFSIIISNPSHHLFYSRFDFWGDSFGILFYVHMVLEYAFILIGSVYGFLSFRRKFRGKKIWYQSLIAFAIMFPWIINFLYITKYVHQFVKFLGVPIIFDITPILFVISTTIFAYATFTHDLLDVSPIMKHEIVHNLDSPICVLDSSYAIIYVNKKFEMQFPKYSKETSAGYFRQVNIGEMIGQKVEYNMDDMVFNVYTRKVQSFEENQYLITFTNITDYRAIEEKLLIEQENLEFNNLELHKTIDKLKVTSKIGARNFVARELHDIIGHSLVVAIKLLEVTKGYYKKDKDLCVTALEDCDKAISSGIESMNNITSKEDNYSGHRLEKDIRSMLGQLQTTDISAHLSFKGVFYTLEEKTYDVINRVCKELITNVIKHSNAQEMFLSVQIRKDEIQILVVDNGRGTNKIVHGNGLKGIVERLKLIEGNVEFITSKNEGFMSRISIKRYT